MQIAAALTTMTAVAATPMAIQPRVETPAFRPSGPVRPSASRLTGVPASENCSGSRSTTPNSRPSPICVRMWPSC
jgi:hypothetical protein